MIILDTNVLSSLMQQHPDPQIVAWLDDQPVLGQRKNVLQERFELLLQDDVENRVALFDSNAATQSAQLTADCKACGRPDDIRDTFIAGIALAQRATLATRNTRHFDDLSVPVVNSWADSE